MKNSEVDGESGRPPASNENPGYRDGQVEFWGWKWELWRCKAESYGMYESLEGQLALYNYVHSRWGCPLPVGHIPIPSDAHLHSRWECALPVSYVLIPSAAHPHSRRIYAFLISNIPIPCEDTYSLVIHPHGECTSSRGMGKWCLTGNEDVPHQEHTSSPGMRMCLTGNGDVTHCKCTSSPAMHILTKNAHSTYGRAYMQSMNTLQIGPSEESVIVTDTRIILQNFRFCQQILNSCY